jgi:hypothetical protein
MCSLRKLESPSLCLSEEALSNFPLSALCPPIKFSRSDPGLVVQKGPSIFLPQGNRCTSLIGHPGPQRPAHPRQVGDCEFPGGRLAPRICNLQRSWRGHIPLGVAIPLSSGHPESHYFHQPTRRCLNLWHHLLDRA